MVKLQAMRLLRILLFLIVIVLITLLSQVGGILILVSWLISNLFKFKNWLKRAFVLLVIYALGVLLIIPSIASIWGREQIKNRENLEPASILTVLLFRDYVVKDFNPCLEEISTNLKSRNPKVKIRFLDAGFPFSNKFPMLPHLSHNDGRKLDLSLVYENASGEIVNESKSVSGYGVFEGSKPGEYDQTKDCLNKGYRFYDFPKYLTFGKRNKDLLFSVKGTKDLLESILKSDKIEKIFIEPHLKQRMKLNDPKIRFHGCNAVRHDDHIHLQIF